MIDGVKIKKLKVYQDIPDVEEKKEVCPAKLKRSEGIFIEILRDEDNLMSKFGQSNFTIANQGTIKAFHWHKLQDDLWFFATGKAAVVLYDQRKNSQTFGQTQVIYGGTDDYKLILIPVGVVHGYKVLSKEPSLLFYHVTKSYNRENPDEERIDPFDQKINFDWESLKEER